MYKIRLAAPLLSAALLFSSTAFIPTDAFGATSAPNQLQVAPSGGTYQFSWDSSPGASAYKIQIASDQGFTNIIESSDTYAYGYSTRNSLLSSDTRELYWRVAAYGTGTTASTLSPWSDTNSFTVDSASGPTLLTPSASQEIAYPTPVKFEWASIKDAASYEIQYVPNGDFSNTQLVVSNTTDSRSFIPTVPLTAGTYAWRVRAKEYSTSETNNSNWSTPVTFTVTWPSQTSTVALLTPAESNGANPAVSDPVFTWEPVTGASYYMIKLARNFEMTNVLIDSTKVYGTTFIPPTEILNGEYYWTVDAYDSNGNKGASSAPRKMVKAWGPNIEPTHNDNSNTLATPTPLVGSDNPGSPTALLYGDFNISWTPIPRATFYRIVLTPTLEAGETGINALTCNTPNTSASVVTSAKAGNVTGLVKELGSCFPFPTNDNTFDKYLTYTNSGNPRIWSYTVTGVDYTGNQTTSIQSSTPNNTLFSATSSPKYFTLTKGTTYSETSGLVQIDHSAWNSQYTSVTDFPALTENISNPSPLLKWQPVAGARKYEIRVYRPVNPDDTTSQIATYFTDSNQLRVPSIYQEDNTGLATSYQYKVRALNSAGNYMDVADWTNPSLDRVTWTRTTEPLALSDSYKTQTDSDVIISWTPYFTAVEKEGTSRGYAISYRVKGTTTWTETKIEYPFWAARSSNGTPLPNGTYEFKVANLDASGDVERYSSIKEFVVAPIKPTNIIASKNGPTVNVSWDPSALSDGYQLRWRKDGGAWTQVQSNNTVIKQTATTVSTSVGVIDGNYEFQVRAKNASNNFSEWSDSATVNYAKENILQVTPTDEILPTNGRMLQWTPLANANRYLVQYASSAAGVASATPIETVGNELTLATKLSYGTPYYWKVTGISEKVSGTTGLTRRIIVGESTTNTFYVLTPPNTPAISSLKVQEDNSVNVTWASPAADDSGTGVTTVSYIVRYRPANQIPEAEWAYTSETSPNTTSLNTTALEKATSYEFQLEAKNSEGTSAWSTSKTIATVSEPNAPNNLRFTKTSANEVTLAWAAPTGNSGAATATGYVLYVTPTGGATTRKDIGLVNTYTVSDLVGATEYTFELRAYNGIGEGAAAVVTGITLETPSAPRDLKATPRNNAVALSWKAPATSGSKTVDSYRIEYSVNNKGSWSGWSNAGTSRTTTFTHEDLKNNQTYKYRVFAVSSTGESLPSSEKTATPGLPNKVKVKLSSAKGKINITWTKAKPGPIKNYTVMYSMNGKQWKKLAVVKGSQNKLSTKKGSKGKYFYVKVAAKNLAGSGLYSSVAKIRKK